MKKLKMLISFFLLIIGISFLSSCISREPAPKIYMFHPEVDFSYLKFDIKVVEPEEVLIDEIYIRLYQDKEEVETYTSKDGIHKVGVTENVIFSALVPETQYRIDFSFDYYVGEYKEENAVMHSYYFKTTANHTGISGEIFNWTFTEGTTKFGANFDDVNRIATDCTVYLKSGNEILTSLNQTDGVLHIGRNRNLSFGPLPPNTEYTIELCMSFTYDEKEYKDLVVDKKRFATENYSYYPTAKISSVSTKEDAVTFDLTLNDAFNLLLDYSVVLVDIRDNIVSELSKEDGLSIGINHSYKLDGMYPNQFYTIRVIAYYKTPFATIKNAILAEYEVKTSAFEIAPTAEITNIVTEDDVVTFKYSIKDRYHEITDYSIVLLNPEDRILKKLTKEDGVELGENEWSFNLLSPKTVYKLGILVSYKNKKEVVTDKYLVKKTFETGEYLFFPTATIVSVAQNEDELSFDYLFSDPYSLLTSLQCRILSMDNEIIKTIDLTDKMSNACHNVLLNEMPNTPHYKIQLLATYSDGISEKEDVILESFEYIENAKDDFTYSVTDSGVIINQYIGNSDICIIPNKIENVEVVTIGSSAFEDSTITKVLIPSSVTCIEDSAFRYCKNLTNITIPDSVTSIENNSFDGCYNLENVYYEGSMESWCEIKCSILRSSSRSAHFYLRNSYNEWEEVTSIEIPNTITEIGDYQFYGFDNVHTIIIPEGVTSIGRDAFGSCRNLKSITLPDSVTSIGTYAFSSCSNLETIVLPNSVTSIGEYTFGSCTNLKDIILPNSVTNLGSYVFYSCSSLQSITISSSMTKIGYDSFSGCDSLENVYYEGTIEDWCGIYFSGFCANPMHNAQHLYLRNQNNEWEEVTSIEIPNTITEIGDYQFYGFNNVISITILNGVTSIGISAFSFCRNLKSITLPDSVTSIGAYAFESCTNLKDIILPNSVTNLGSYAFTSCSSLQSITIPSSMTKIGYDSFSGCDSLENVYYEGTIEDWCGIYFSGFCANPMYYDPMTSTKHLYFRNQNNEWEEVTSIEIPNTITEIGQYQFYWNNLISITMPNSVISIKSSAFSNISNLYYGGSIEDWCNISFKEISSNPMHNAQHFYLRNQNNEWEEVTSIEIPNTITEIGDYQFYGFSNVKTIIIPEGVTSIGRDAFRDCSNLQSVTIPNSVISIGNGAFWVNTIITEVFYEGTMESWCKLNVHIFSNHSTLPHHFYLRNQNNVWEEVTSIEIPNTITEIGDYQFCGFDNVHTIILPESVTSIGACAFESCTRLESIILSSNLESIGSFAFYECLSLTSITIPTSVTSIGQSAFVASTKKIIYNGSSRQWDKIIKINAISSDVTIEFKRTSE